MIIKAANERYCRRRHVSQSAMTLLEFVVVIMVVAFTLLFLARSLARPNHRAPLITCASNLKQVALAFRIWEGDHGDHFSGLVYTNGLGAAQFANAFRYFQVMSNEIYSPKVLLCPSDKKRREAVNFATDFDDTHVSYFAGLNADDAHPQSMLAGDSNLENGAPLKNQLMELTTNQNITWGNNRHHDIGNIAFADGSVQQVSNAALQITLSHSGLTTNKLLFP